MARLLPPYIERNYKSSAEKNLFDIFRRSSFAKDWIVLHSLNLAQHSKQLYGEIDFLILIPNGGIYVMEVKGGDVKCVDGVWHFTDRHGNSNQNKSPFNQARDAMFSLIKAIEKEFGKGHRFTKILCGFLCAFPHVSFNKHSVEYEPWQILDRDSLDTDLGVFFHNLVQKFIQKHRSQRWFSDAYSLPDIQELSLLCDFLRGNFERIRTAEERLVDFDKDVEKYTDEQFRVLDSIQLNERSLVQGSAGTGKTMIAIESAVRAAVQGKRVFLTCYNRLIGEWMQQQLSSWQDKIVVSNLHSFLIDQSKGFDYKPEDDNKQDFYNKYLPLLLRDMYDKGIVEKFDKIIIDEGQDLIRPEYLILFNSMLKNGLSSGNWEIYGDFERQAIYSQISKDVMLKLLSESGYYSNFLLKINCRNTKQIGEETSLVSGFEQPPFLLEYLEGISVEYLFYSDRQHQRHLVGEYLRKRQEENFPMKELIILSPRKFENSFASSISDFLIKEVKNSRDWKANDESIGFSTIQSYKGMESNYVLITDIEDLSSEIAKSLLYIGMSRAKHGLIIFVAEEKRDDYREILKRKLL